MLVDDNGGSARTPDAHAGTGPTTDPAPESGTTSVRALFLPTVSPGGTAAALVVVRFLSAGIWAWGVKTKLPWNGFGWFPGWIEKEIQYAEIAPYRWFLETVVQPNITFFGWMQFFVELALVTALVLGIFSGATGLLATVWSLNIALGSYPIPGEWIPGLLAFVMLSVLVWAGRPGRYFGIDARLRPRLLQHDRPAVRWFAAHMM